LKAIVQDAYGSADSLELRDIDRPSIGPHEVLVRVAAAGVDRGAVHLMRGLPFLVRLMGYGVHRPKVRVPGTNVAGQVEAVGAAVTDFAVGDAVYGTCRGAYAEYACAREDRLAPAPATVTLEQAAVLPYAGAPALEALLEQASLAPGQAVLVVGASGAVGSVAVQIAKAFRAKVTGVCGPTNVEFVEELGADRVLDYTRADFADDGRRYDVVLDIGGRTPVRRLRRALSPTGTLVIVGGEGGGRLTGGVQRQLWAQMRSPFVSQKLRTFIASEDARYLRALNELVDRGSVTPILARAYALPDAAQAVRDLEAGHVGGRLVVTT
jgi:NADPH:quinone reductase-like Zn-dependent oxidoreductase